jgi:uncharacterized protein (TIGR03067 family)
LVRAEQGGESAPLEVTEQILLIIDRATYEVRYAGQATDRGTLLADATVTSENITLESAEGINAGRKIPAIYQVRGNLLRICYGLEGTPPVDFSGARDDHYLAVYKKG